MPFPKLLLKRRLWIGVVGAALFCGVYIYVHFVKVSFCAAVAGLRDFTYDVILSHPGMTSLRAPCPCSTGSPWPTQRP